jgi:hypothetical protein
MIKWHGDGPAAGFTYYPALEIGVGIFLMIASVIVPLLFVYYNGIKAENWAELLFCAGFFLLFMFMGHSLTFQTLQVALNNKKYSFYQNLREPPTAIEMKEYDWEGIKTEDEKVGEETFIVLKLKTFEKEIEFYRSVNRGEINTIVDALGKIRKNSEEEKE